MPSVLSQKIAKLSGLIDTEEFDEWTNNFVYSIVKQIARAGTCDRLTDKQIDKITSLHKRYFPSHNPAPDSGVDFGTNPND